MKKKLLALPIEIYKREFAERLFMALIAASRGYRVVIGESNHRIFKKAKNGILFYKDHAVWTEGLFKKAKKNGMKICAFDEEGLIVGDRNLYQSARISIWALDNLDAIFCWGNNQKNTLSSVKKSYNLHVCGSSKIDIAKLFSKCALQNTSRSQMHVLINTRFTYNNGAYKDFDVDNLIGLGVIKSSDDLDYYRDLCRSEEKIYEEFCSLIKLLGNKGKYKVTVRPHPLEEDNSYEEMAAIYPNITVDRNADLRQQILGADVIIHDGCTTAIEARAMGKPVLGLRPPNLYPAYDDFSNSFSYNFTNADELLFFLESNDLERAVINVNQFADSYIENWSKTTYATSCMIDVMDSFSTTLTSELKFGLLERIDVKEILYDFLQKNKFIAKILSLIVTSKYRHFINSRNILRSKFPKLNRSDIEGMIKMYSSLDDVVPSMREISIKVVGDRLLFIELAEAGK